MAQPDHALDASMKCSARRPCGRARKQYLLTSVNVNPRERPVRHGYERRVGLSSRTLGRIFQ